METKPKKEDWGTEAESSFSGPSRSSLPYQRRLAKISGLKVSFLAKISGSPVLLSCFKVKDKLLSNHHHPS